MPDTGNVCISVCKNIFVCLPWLLLFIFFGLFDCFHCKLSCQLPSTKVQRWLLKKEYVAHIKLLKSHTQKVGNIQADVVIPQLLSHPSNDLLAQLYESGCEGPERDQSIRLLWQGWGWHLEPVEAGEGKRWRTGEGGILKSWEIIACEGKMSPKSEQSMNHSLKVFVWLVLRD